MSSEDKKSGISSTAAVNDPDAQLFEDIFKVLEEELPPLLLPGPGDGTFTTRGQAVPESPLSVRTVLIEDEAKLALIEIAKTWSKLAAQTESYEAVVCKLSNKHPMIADQEHNPRARVRPDT